MNSMAMMVDMSSRMIMLAVAALFVLAAVAGACPNCRDTIANTVADDVASLPAGFNYSIYWMLLGLFGAMGIVARTIYKGLQTHT
jgi:hypothetical protein